MTDIKFKPRRGSANTMATKKKDLLLDDGEIFIEKPDERTGDNQYKIKIGDGSTTYENLPYAVDPTNISSGGGLEKLTYEYNKEMYFGSTGLVCIGKFSCYDTNISIEIKSTTSTTYYAVAILATQNIIDGQAGLFVWNTYADSANTVTPNLYAKYTTDSTVIELYFQPSAWSKNHIHISCVGLRGEPTNICEMIDSKPSNATIQPTNTMLVRSAVLESVGSATSSTVKYQRLNLNGGSSLTVVDGTLCMEATKSLSTSGNTQFEFSNSNINSNKYIQVATNIFGVNPISVSISGTSCYVIFPPYSSAASLTCRIYIRG